MTNFPRFLNNRLVGQVCIGLHRLLVEHKVQMSASLLDPHGRPTKMSLQMTISYSGPGQHHDKMISRDSSEEVDDDRKALLNLEQNIANIERSMSASQLEQAQYKLTGNKVRRTKWSSLILLLPPTSPGTLTSPLTGIKTLHTAQ